MPALEDRCRALVAELGIAPDGAVGAVVPLTGGVASDIAMVEVAGRRICVKFALGRLKVAEEWLAPTHRNAAEYAWLTVAASIVPDGAVQLYGRSERLHGFAMEYLEGSDVTLWKAELLRGAAPGSQAERVGDMLGLIHRGSARSGFDTAPFHNRDDFRALRIEPYLTFTAGRHPALAPALTALADMLHAGDKVLVHGDVSPKNILFRGARPVMLDAECATMGDASFDPAFCLNHLLLKSIHLPQGRAALLAAVKRFWSAYAAHIVWEDAAALEARVARLIPALMLARVDGKSPVEYLTGAEATTTRALSVALIGAPETTIKGLCGRIALHLKELNA